MNYNSSVSPYLQAFITILSGVVVFVIGQVVVKLVIDPVQAMKTTIGQISHAMNEYAPAISNPGLLPEEKQKEAYIALRKLSAELEAHLYLVPRYNITRCVFGLPTHKQVQKAISQLIGIANSLGPSNNPKIYEIMAARVEKLRDALGIYMDENERISNVP